MNDPADIPSVKELFIMSLTSLIETGKMINIPFEDLIEVIKVCWGANERGVDIKTMFDEVDHL
jgi:hypothetical protein